MPELIFNGLGLLLVGGFFALLCGIARGGGQGPTWKGRL